METVTTPANYFSLILDSDFRLVVEVSPCLVLGAVGLVILVIVIRFFQVGSIGRSFEIDEAEFGIGDQKLKLKPNLTDKQIAYKIWVELSTRKIGLPIDLEDDVIDEIYDSWYSFFSVTRELIKDVPVSKFNRKETEKIIKLSIDVLNLGLRPHLTKWQARYRKWYEAKSKNEKYTELSPQDIQREFPKFEELEMDLLQVNTHLISYRDKMYELVTRLGP